MTRLHRVPLLIVALVTALSGCSSDSNSNAGGGGEADAADDDLTFPDLGGVSEDGGGLTDAVVSSTCPDEDGFSPNHGPAEAHSVPRAGLDEEDLHLCAGFDDFFVLELDEGDGVMIIIEFANRIGDLDLWLLPEGTTDQDDAVAVGGTEEDVEEIRWVAEEAGTYVLMVDGFEDAEGYYDLLIRPTCRVDADCPGDDMVCLLQGRFCDTLDEPLCGEDAHEPNNRADGATDLGLDGDDSLTIAGVVCGDDWDYFSFSLDDVSNVEVELDWDGEGDLAVAVLGSDGDVLDSAGGDPRQPGAHLEMARVAAGDYLVYVTSLAGGTTDSAYSLDVVVEGADGCEDDSDCDQAFGRAICSDSGGCVSYQPDEPNPIGGLCDSDDDCDDTTQGCYEGGPGLDDNVCTRQCRGDDDCGDAQCLAVGGGRFGGLCFGGCEADTNCPAPYVCGEGGECEFIECGVDADCGDGRACLRGEQGGAFCRTYEETACDDQEADGNGRMSDAVALDLESMPLEDLTICDEDRDWYSLEVAEGPALIEISVAYEGDETDLDVYLYDAMGNTVAEGVTSGGNPEVVQADFVAAGTYYVFVNQFPNEESNPVTSYDLTASVSVVDGCTAEGEECHDLQPFRFICNDDGSCGFLEGNGELELGALCDSQDDCGEDAQFCFTFEGTEYGQNICTRPCGNGDDCADVADATCTPLGGRFAVCLPE